MDQQKLIELKERMESRIKLRKYTPSEEMFLKRTIDFLTKENGERKLVLFRSHSSDMAEYGASIYEKGFVVVNEKDGYHIGLYESTETAEDDGRVNKNIDEASWGNDDTMLDIMLSFRSMVEERLDEEEYDR